MRVYQGGASKDFARVNASTSGERGLLGLAVSTDRFVYAFYSRADDTTKQRVVRWPDCAGNAGPMQVIVDNLPGGTDCCHKGGRLALGPDGKLFVTLGETHVPNAAQDPADPRGKVLRYNPDGSGQEVWVAGLRNPFGIAIAPDGTMALTNNGPSGDAGTPCGSCGDEFYVVGKAAGIVYQWPYCWGYSHPFNGQSGCHGLPGPQYSTEGGPYARGNPYFVAPTGVAWVQSGKYANHFVFCADIDAGNVLEYMGQGSVSDTGIPGCLLDVKQGPDGALYVSNAGTISRSS